jgi:hypothetical protein
MRLRSTHPHTPLGQDLSELAQAANAGASQARQALTAAQGMGLQVEQLKQMLVERERDYQALRDALARVQVQGRVGDPNIQRIENIPGRRIPFDYTVDILIQAGQTATVQGTISISQEGPFVAVARYATFQSGFQFSYTPPGSTSAARFNGRSFGRYRPVHSAYDFNDGQPVAAVTYAQAFPGTGAPHIVSPSNAASFRSMEGDFRIQMREGGSSFPRSFLEVPSSLWVKANGDAFPLGALDFFERGEVLQFNIIPTHVPNPAFGNISGFAAAFTDFPFIDSQWDAIEGINDQAQDIGDTDTDPIVRQANGMLTIGFHGYRIYQPAGAGQY